METLRFKTTIKCSGCVAKATPFLNEAIGEDNWEVETDKPEKILKVPAGNDPDKIIDAVKKAGFKAEKV